LGICQSFQSEEIFEPLHGFPMKLLCLVQRLIFGNNSFLISGNEVLWAQLVSFQVESWKKEFRFYLAGMIHASKIRRREKRKKEIQRFCEKSVSEVQNPLQVKLKEGDQR